MTYGTLFPSIAVHHILRRSSTKTPCVIFNSSRNLSDLSYFFRFLASSRAFIRFFIAVSSSSEIYSASCDGDGPNYYSNGKGACYACPNGGVRKSHGCIGTAAGCCTKDVSNAPLPQFITQPYPQPRNREPYKFEVGKMYYVTFHVFCLSRFKNSAF